VKKTLPPWSSATADIASCPEPPKNVDQIKPVPVELSMEM
jgi:hypothetical protein